MSHAATCRECGGALQRIPSMPGHLVCGSGHLFQDGGPPPAAQPQPEPASAPLRRVGGERPPAQRR